MAWYVELHCDTPNCRHGSNEEGPQGRDKRTVAKEARRCGWRETIVGNRWYCAGCVVDRDKACAP